MAAPLDDEVELTLIGPGYGEAIAVHLGGGDWMAVDSCEDPENQSVPLLDYFEANDIDAARQVRFVVATHFHDDHMRGLGSLLAESTDAFLVHSPAVDDRACQALIAVESESADGLGRGFRELRRAVDLLRQRKREDGNRKVREIALAGSLLYDEGQSRVRALSPSSEAVIATQEYFGRLLRVGSDKNTVPRPNPNHAAIVLWVEALGHTILLGSDLVRHANPQQGWLHILSNPLIPPMGRADLIKVPHHGGQSAHVEGVWSELLATDPISLVCPWTLGRRSLPTADDLDRLCGLSKEVWISGPLEDVSMHLPDPGPEQQWPLGSPGRVTARRKIDEPAWRIEAAPPGQLVCSS